MASEAKYTTPLQVPTTPAQRERVITLAARRGVSQAQVVRDILDDGLDAAERAAQ